MKQEKNTGSQADNPAFFIADQAQSYIDINSARCPNYQTLTLKSAANFLKNQMNNSEIDRFNFFEDLQAGLDVRISNLLKLKIGLFYRQFLKATKSSLH